MNLLLTLLPILIISCKIRDHI